jgi:hypothetical protein
MEKIPTVEEMINKHTISNPKENWERNGKSEITDYKAAMIEFAALHVEAALKSKVKEMTERSYEDSSYSMKELDSFTKNSYPLENIK